jgi:hypothetical protein
VTAAPWPPSLPAPDTAPHSWRCSRPPVEDRYVVDPKTGESRVERRCPSCGGIERKPRPT